MSLAERVNGAIEEHGEAWLAKAIDRAQKLANERLNGEELELAVLGLLTLEHHKPQLAELGAEGARRVLGALSLGDRDSARLVWLATAATYEERRAAAKQATADAAAARESHAAAVDDVLDGLLKVGKVALRIVLALLV